METESNNPTTSVPQSGKYPRMASFAERLGAYIVDYLIIAAFTSAIYAIFYPAYFFQLSQSFNTGLGAQTANTLAVGPQIFLSGMTIIAFLFYYGWFYTTRGQTIGKMAMKIKVVRVADLKYLSWGEAILREVVRAFLSGLVLFLGYLWYFMSDKRQTWHDSIAGSYVVKTDEAGNLLMDGPSVYPKEPVKTFSCCGGCAILMALFFGLLIWGVSAISNSPEFREIFRQEFSESGNIEYNLESEEDIRLFLEENFPEELEEIEQQLNGREDQSPSL